MSKVSLETRFMRKVQKTESCWLWRAAMNIQGYGKMWDGENITQAHRISWRLYRGEIPTGKFVLHSCDNSICVNPKHLFIGSQLENMRDMIAKGRRGYTGHLGEKNKKSKLNPKNVLAIRELFKQGKTRAELSLKFKVNWGTIDGVVKLKNWKQVT